MKHRLIPLALALGLLLSCAACGTQSATTGGSSPTPAPEATPGPAADGGETAIVLSDDGITVDGASISSDSAEAVYTGAEIVYYESGRGEAYGAGTEEEAHTPEEAAGQTVVTITRPGVYRVSGTLSAGQLAIDLGEDAAEDPSAVVTLILDGVELSCQVAPAVIFYNVYECGSADAGTASATVDTTAAGANVVVADGSVNNVAGSHVAKIYQEGTENKLHKYDGAFYSKMSMNITGERQGTGVLNITADNEGLDSELHLTINGGVISIQAQNDGINTNEDGVSVTTVNGGSLSISAGLGAEGDGIDSNGYLVINGGEVVAAANGRSGDGGLDADLGVYLNGGTVIALGSRNDEASTGSRQPYLELSFAQTLPAGSTVSVRDADGNSLLDYTAERDFATLTFTSNDLAEGVAYSVYVDEVQQQFTGHSFGMGGGFGGGMPGGQAPDGEPPALPDGVEPGERPDGAENGERPQRPDGWEDITPTDGGNGQAPTGGKGGPGERDGQAEAQEPSTEFILTADQHSFSGVTGADLLS